MPDLIRHPVFFWIPGQARNDNLKIFYCRINKTIILRNIFMKTTFHCLMLTIYSWIICTVSYADGKGLEHHKRFESDDVIVTLGVLTLISMISTFLMGYFMPKNRKLLFSWHKRAGIATLILGITHALTVLLFD
jgi:hypothetical protein